MCSFEELPFRCSLDFVSVPRQRSYRPSVCDPVGVRLRA